MILIQIVTSSGETFSNGRPSDACWGLNYPSLVRVFCYAV